MPQCFIRDLPTTVSTCPACGAYQYVLVYVDFDKLRHPVILEDKFEIRCSSGPSTMNLERAEAWFEFHQSWISSNPDWDEDAQEEIRSKALDYIRQNFDLHVDSRSGKISLYPHGYVPPTPVVLGQNRIATGSPYRPPGQKPRFPVSRKEFAFPPHE